MNRTKLEKYRDTLRAMGGRLASTVAGLEDEARTATGGQSQSNLSNTPLHMGDLGTEEFLQEMSATVYENEEYLHNEVTAALGRIEAGTFGACEHCGKAIPAARLDALPYTRYCVKCSEKLKAGLDVNLNHGRPQAGAGTLAQIGYGPAPPRGGRESPAGEPTPAKGRPEIPFTDLEAARTKKSADDVHAVGTAGGGTAIGGLAGTNVGHGDPAGAPLEDAIGSGNFDTRAEDEGEGAEESTAFAGPTGGAVGGTPANKRATGGKTRRGVSPKPGKSGRKQS